jgi:thymidine kinase
MPGQLTVITGPMFAGKTEALLHVIREATDLGKTVCAFKPRVDDRYSKDKIVSHSKQSYPATVIAGDVPLLSVFMGHRHIDLVAVDEVQFFEHQLVEEIPDILETGRSVVVSGLDLTYEGRPFGIVPELLALADNVVKLSAKCARCGDKATRTYRTALTHSKYAGPSDPAFIGGAETYEPRCFDCFLR